MSDMPEYPTLEPRRGRQLRQDFLRDMAAIAPQWRGLAEAAGTDRALLEIAARLLEHSTRRLDKTPERDGLAFLDMLDVPAPQPRSAEGHAVIALDADQDAPVQLEGRAGFDLDNDGETVRFETTDALNIHPARVVSLFTVDPAADQIGEAPPAVVALEADNSEELSYQLDSAVGGNDRILRLSFATGLEEGDLLRIEEETDQIRIRQIESVSDDGLVTLTEPVGTPELFPGKVALRKMSWLDAFSMPDKQEHALYVGDAAALDVSPQAEITLSFKGRQSESLSSADAIAATPSVVEIWGQKGDDEEPGWHRLPEVARTVDTVTYLKAWAGPVLEAEIAPDQKNRWLRLRRLGPITLGSDEADLHKLRVDQIFIQVKMLVNEATPPADTISQAAHNATPLPISDTFFPFGTEPQRFDSFALAAPEVFTKSGAKAKLKFDMQDATLVAMQSVLAETGMRRPHIFGVGKNGRIQVLDRAASSQYWLEVDALEPGGTDAPPVNVDFGIQAVTVPPAVDQINLVLVEAGTEGSPQLYVVPIEVADSVLTDGQGNGGAGKWQALNMHRDSQVPAKMRSAVALVPMVVGGANPSAAQVYWVTTTGVHRFRLAANGAPATGAAWEEVGNDLSAPTLDETARIVPMQGSFEGGEGSFLITDENQTLWKLSVDATGAGSWANLGLVVQENSLVEAVSWHEQGGGELDTIAFVPPGGGLKIWNTGGADDDVDPPAGYGEPAWFALIQGIAPQPIATTEQYDRPSLVAVYAGAGTAILVERNLEPTGEALRHQIGALGDITVALPRAASESAKIVTALGDQTIASLTFNPAVEAEFLTWFSADVASGDVTDLRIEHSNGDFTNVGKSFQVGNTATRRIAFPDGIDPDPAFGMELWHMDAGITGAFNDGTGRVQSSTGALPTAGAPVFIAPSGSGDFRRYTVDATQGATDTFTVDEETELAAHIGGSGNVVFREVQGNAPLETVAAVDVPDSCGRGCVLRNWIASQINAFARESLQSRCQTIQFPSRLAAWSDRF
ncbi:conserved hypothetical protein [Rhodobacteraceae bacterium KLH11]|nr:conserved hypothetical protein [Rhodobacteraceae bacterium KLH11]